MIKKIIHTMLYEKLGAFLSKATGLLVAWEGPRFLIAIFIKVYFIHVIKVNINEAPSKKLRDYSSLNAFFTRALRPETRPIDPHPRSIIAPCDGKVLLTGITQTPGSYNIKGQTYSLAELISPDHRDAEKIQDLIGGYHTLIYLSPRDCHRIVAPLTGTLYSVEYIEGSLYPVKESFLGSTLDVFARNRRLKLVFTTPHGRAVMVWVGAFNVGRFATTFDPTFFKDNNKAADSHKKNPRAGGIRDHREKLYPHPQRMIQKGEDLGAFELGGSSVLIFLSKGLADLHSKNQTKARIGEVIGTLIHD